MWTGCSIRGSRRGSASSKSAWSARSSTCSCARAPGRRRCSSVFRYNHLMSLLRAAAILTVTVAAASQVAAFQRYSKQEGDKFQAKLARIVLYGATPAVAARNAGQTTDVTDDELNSYL